MNENGVVMMVIVCVIKFMIILEVYVIVKCVIVVVIMRVKFG